jgi:hypothetical protein
MNLEPEQVEFLAQQRRRVQFRRKQLRQLSGSTAQFRALEKRWEPLVFALREARGGDDYVE